MKKIKPRPVLKKPHSETEFDVDYWHKLDAESLAWLKKFESEYIKGRGLKKESKPLHKTNKLKKSVNDARNAARREAPLVLADAYPTVASPEDAYIRAIDLIKKNK